MSSNDNEPTEYFGRHNQSAHRSRHNDNEYEDYQTRVDLPTSGSGWPDTYNQDSTYNNGYSSGQQAHYSHQYDNSQAYPQTQGYNSDQTYPQPQGYASAPAYPQTYAGSQPQTDIQQQNKLNGISGGEIARFIFSMLAVIGVTALTTYVAGTIINAIIEHVIAGDFAVQLGQIPVAAFATLAAGTALLAALVWALLNTLTSAGSLFYNWIVGLLLIAAVVLPLLTGDNFSRGVLHSIMYLIIGIPIAFLVGPVARSCFKHL